MTPMKQFLFLFVPVVIGARLPQTNFTSLVNLFIGTASGANGGSGGNGFPGAAVPHAMAKVKRVLTDHTV